MKKIMADVSTQERIECELRAAPRVSLKGCAKLIIANESDIHIHLVDISLSGVGICAERPLLAGLSCLIQFDLDFNNQSRLMVVRGTVIFCIHKAMEGFRIGIHASQVDPELAQYIHTRLH